MDKGTTIRAFIIAFVAVLITSLVIVAQHISIFQLAAEHLTVFAIIQRLAEGAIEHILAIIFVGICAFNYHAILLFVRRSLTRTDELIIGKWYVYRYTKTHGRTELLSDTWTVRRNLSRNYIVDILSSRRILRGGHRGRVICNERDRFNILLEGHDHKEQSLVCLSPRIPVVDGDSRVLGMGIGDDADYVLSARPYLASRSELPKDYVEALLKDASAAVLKHGENEQLIQFPSSIISELFLRHPLPPPTSET